MSVTAKRKTTIVYSGDVGGTEEIEAADNTSSPGQIENKALSNGNNTITVPTGATALTIMKPSGNTVTLTFKGANASDAGVALHLTDPDTITVGSGVTQFVINATASVTVRLFWS